MKTTDCSYKKSTSSRLILSLLCLLVFHAANAKSDSTASAATGKSKELILSLPNTELKGNDSPWSAQPLLGASTDTGKQLIAGGRKKTPLAVDCGMDVYQNSGPDVSLTSRLTGECDFKYHY